MKRLVNKQMPLQMDSFYVPGDLKCIVIYILLRDEPSVDFDVAFICFQNTEVHSQVFLLHQVSTYVATPHVMAAAKWILHPSLSFIDYRNESVIWAFHTLLYGELMSRDTLAFHFNPLSRNLNRLRLHESFTRWCLMQSRRYISDTKSYCGSAI